MFIFGLLYRGIYEGEFTNNILNGQGKITYANGDIYKGEFKNHKLNGQGKITYANGNIHEGIFKDNYLYNNTQPCNIM